MLQVNIQLRLSTLWVDTFISHGYIIHLASSSFYAHTTAVYVVGNSYFKTFICGHSKLRYNTVKKIQH